MFEKIHYLETTLHLLGERGKWWDFYEPDLEFWMLKCYARRN